jgi:hypothetical protein
MRRQYVIFDKVAQLWIGQPLIDRSDAPVIRLFHDVLADSSSLLGKHPADYELRYVGQLADDGDMIPSTVSVVATGSAWLAARSQESFNVAQ